MSELIGYLRDLADGPAKVDAHKLRAAANEIERLRLDPWRPIETAPKDGTEVLVWDGFNAMVSAFIVLNSGGDWSTLALCAEEPTHWMPVPSPPK